MYLSRATESYSRKYELQHTRKDWSLMHRKNKANAVIIDHYSFYPEVVSIASTSAGNAIKFLKSLFARHGIPKTLRVDNMPFGS